MNDTIPTKLLIITILLVIPTIKHTIHAPRILVHLPHRVRNDRALRLARRQVLIGLVEGRYTS